MYERDKMNSSSTGSSKRGAKSNSAYAAANQSNSKNSGLAKIDKGHQQQEKKPSKKSLKNQQQQSQQQQATSGQVQKINVNMRSLAGLGGGRSSGQLPAQRTIMHKEQMKLADCSKEASRKFIQDQQSQSYDDSSYDVYNYNQYDSEELSSGNHSHISTLKNSPNRRTSLMKRGSEHESDYNYACSNESSPEHKIHTVVAGTQSTAPNQQINPQIVPSSVSLFDEQYNDGEQIIQKQSSHHQQQIKTSSKKQNQTSVRLSEISEEEEEESAAAKFNISQYTDGNMAEFMEEESKEAVQKDKAEFMYAFEGAMSVIQETDEPDDEITIKAASAQSSIMQASMMQRPDSLATNPPNGQTSKELATHKSNDKSIRGGGQQKVAVQLQPQSKKQQNSNHQQNLSASPQRVQRKKSSGVKDNSKNNNSYTQLQRSSQNNINLEDSQIHNTHLLESIDESKPSFNLMLLNTQHSGPQLKSMQTCKDKNKKQSTKKDKSSSATGGNSNHSGKQKTTTSTSKATQIIQLKSYLQKQQAQLIQKNAAAQFAKTALVLQSPPQQPIRTTTNVSAGSKTHTTNTIDFFTLPQSATMQGQQQYQHTSSDDQYSNGGGSEAPEQHIVVFSEKPSAQQQRAKEPIEQQLQIMNTTNYYQPRCNREEQIVVTPRQLPSSSKAAVNERIGQILSPKSSTHIVVSSKSCERNESNLQLQHNLQDLNKSIVSLKDEIKSLSVQIYKELKTQNLRVQQKGNQLEDKLDSDFLEKIMQVYAFFTSCLNLVHQNDKEAHKLLILQPMIEKHITELKLDQYAVQASSTANDFFGGQNETLSSICGQSFNTSTTSINNHQRNQSGSENQYQLINLRSSRQNGGLSASQKLSHLQSLLKIADQVLQLNCLKHKLIVDGKRNGMQHHQNNPKHLIQSHSQEQLVATDSIIPNPIESKGSPCKSGARPVGPLFEMGSDIMISDQTSKRTTKSGSRRRAKQSQIEAALAGINSPDNTSTKYKAATTADPNNNFGQEIYYQQSEQRRQTIVAQKKNPDGQVLVTPVRSQKTTTTDNGQASTLESSGGERTSSSRPNYRRNRSVGQLLSPRDDNQTSNQQQQYQQPFIYQYQGQSTSATHTQHINAATATDTYFSTITATTSPKGGSQSANRYQQDRDSIQGCGPLFNMTSAKCKSFVTTGERPSQESKQTMAQTVVYQQATNSHQNNTSFGVMNSSAGGCSSSAVTGGASRTAHQAYHQYQQLIHNQQKGGGSQQHSARSAAQLSQGQSPVQKGAGTSIMSSLKDNADSSFITVMQSSNNENHYSDSQQQQHHQHLQQQIQDTSWLQNTKFHQTASIQTRPQKLMIPVPELSCDQIELDYLQKPIVGLVSSRSAESSVGSTQKPYEYESLHKKATSSLVVSPQAAATTSKKVKTNGQLARSNGDRLSGIKSLKSTQQQIARGSLSPSAIQPDSSRVTTVLHTPCGTGGNNTASSSRKQISRNTNANSKKQLSKTTLKQSHQIMLQNQSESMSDIEMSSISQVTIDQFDNHQISGAKGATTGSKNLSKIKKRMMATTQQQSSYLASLNASVSHLQTCSNEVPRSERRGQQPQVQHQPESKIKKALKGVISAQEAFGSNGKRNASAGAPTKHSNNTSTNLTMYNPTSQSHQSSFVKQSPRRHENKTLKKNHSVKYHNLTQQVSLQGSTSSSKMNSPEKRKMVKMHSLNSLANMPYTTQQSSSNHHSNRSSHLNTQPILPSNQPKKTKASVLNSQRTSNYLLKQQITVDTDKIMSKQYAQASTLSKQMAALSPSSQKKDLTQAFDAVAKAICTSKRNKSKESSTTTPFSVSQKSSFIILK